MSPLRLAIVHDALVGTGGAERVAAFMASVFPDAPVFTSAYLPDATFPEFRRHEVITLPGGDDVRTERDLKRGLPRWIAGFHRLDLSAFHAVLSSSTFAAKFVRPPRETRHVCYLYAPFRLLWKREAYSDESLPVGRVGRWALAAALPLLRSIDRSATRRIPELLTSCEHMRQELRAVYGRDSTVLYPPIDLSQYARSAAPRDYYLCVGRLVSHKRVDVAVEACRALGRELWIVGDGPERASLERIGGPTVRFLGRVSDAELRNSIYPNCRALLFPSHEDFGLVPIEAQASGRPVIAFARGGALETVTADVSGVFFDEQTASSAERAILEFERRSFESERVRESVSRFDVGVFATRLREMFCGVAAGHGVPAASHTK